jgi:cell division septation protein DedD
VITRIIWLKGLQAENAHAFSRCIYIHGTPEERTIGRPASYGCIRMKSRDVAELYAQLPIGAIVEIVQDKLPNVPKAPAGTTFALQTASKPEPDKVAAETDTPAAVEKEKPAPVKTEKPAPVEKPAAKPKPVKKVLKEQQHFGRGA